MNWPLVKLGDVASIFNGKTPSKKEQRDSGHPVLKIKNVNERGVFKGVFESFVDVELSSKFENKKLKIDDTLILNAAHNSNYVGSKQYRAEMSVMGSLPTGEWLITRANRECLDPRFLNYWLASSQAKFGIKLLVKGIHLYPKDVARLEIPLPPLKEQKRIAAILDKADAIRRKRQQAIQLADEFLRSVFLDMFGDPVSNPKGWKTEKFSDVGTLDRGKSKHRPRNDPSLLGGDHPLIQTGDVANSKGYIKKYKSTYSDVGLKQSRMWSRGTLCITIAANIAKTGILTFDACFPDSVVGFTPNEKTTVEFIQHWLGFLQKTLEASAPESAQKNINLAILRDLDIPLPDIERQRKFSEAVRRILFIVDKENETALRQENLFSSISQKAFSGKL